MLLRFQSVSMAAVCLLVLPGLRAAELPSEWRNIQSFEIAQAGLVKISVPLDTLTAARPAMEDLRLYDRAGREVPFLLAQPVQPQLVVRPPAQFEVTVNRESTLLRFGTGSAQPVSGVTLVSPSPSFFKAVQIEASRDQKSWQTVAEGQPIFRQANGAQRMFLPIPAGPWTSFRLTVDDRRSAPIPFTAAQFHSESGAPPSGESVDVTMLQRTDEPGQTRLALRFAGMNFKLEALALDVKDPLFTRPVTLSQQQFLDGEIRETIFFRDSLYRVAVEGQPHSENLKTGVDAPIRSREIVLTIQNDDNPPLQIVGVKATRRPAYLTFHAAEPGPFRLLSGNAQCPAPRYELAALKGSLREAAAVAISASALAANPSYRTTDPLAALALPGAALDVSTWAFRKRVQTEGESVQQLELDLEVLTHAAAPLQDLRLLRDNRQIPFVIERTAINRSFPLAAARADDPRRPRVSRWELTLPYSRTPLARLTCNATTPYFQREARLEEERRDERGNSYTVSLGSVTWRRELGAKTAQLSLTVPAPPQTGKVILEIENGDNVALDLQKFEGWYPVTRLLFKTASTAGTFLYYGNAQAVPPQYDLELAGPKLLAADQTKASLAVEEVLKPGALLARASSAGGWMLWTALGVVVAALLFIIARLLPKPPVQAG